VFLAQQKPHEQNRQLEPEKGFDLGNLNPVSPKYAAWL
jgi:hypothetical protein